MKKYIPTLYSWFFLVYCFFASATENINWLWPIFKWNLEPTMVILWVIVWVLMLFTNLTKNGWLFIIPTNIYLGIAFLRSSSLIF